MELDILVFGPHPDDAEIGAGGLLLKMKAEGHRTGIIDMTRGDMGWGTPEERDAECAAAAKVLGLDARESLDLGDCRVTNDFETRLKVAAVIRKYRPKIVIAPYYDIPPGRGLGHNDHGETGMVVSHGYNYAHLRKMPVPGEPHQAKAIYYYFLPPGLRPTFAVDVTAHVDQWRAALECHKSQFFNPDKPTVPGVPTGFMEWFEIFARREAWSVGATYAQAYYAPTPLKVRNPLMLVEDVASRL